MPHMASLHKQPGKPHRFCALTTPDGKRHFRSTLCEDRNQAKKISAGWAKAAELAAQNNLTPDRARKLIQATISDVLESHSCGTMSRDTLKNFFQKAAELVMQPDFTRELVNGLVTETVRHVASTCQTPRLAIGANVGWSRKPWKLLHERTNVTRCRSAGSCNSSGRKRTRI